MSKRHFSLRVFLLLVVFVNLTVPIRSLDLIQFASFDRPHSIDGDDQTSSIAITTLDVPITQNFDTLATSGAANAWTDDTTLTGWYSQFSLQPANPTTYRAETGSGNTGALYSFGVAGINPLTERALGSIASGTPGNIFYAVKLTNNTGSAIGSFDLSFVGEQWRAAGCTPTPCTPASQTLDFQYQVANAGVITDANTPATGWTDVNSLDFTTPNPGSSTASALDGNVSGNRTAKAGTIGPTVNPGQEIWLRWMDINDANNDHGLAIDDVSITPHGPSPDIDVSPTSLDFGDQQVGTTSAGMTVTISNNGSADLHISGVVTGNVVFSIVNSPAGTTITPGDNAQFSVTFSPVTQQIYTSNLVISSDDPDEGAVVVPLTGRGVNNPEIGVSPTFLNFGNQTVGTASAPQTITISNTGTGDLSIQSVVTGLAAYSITNSPAGTTIGAGDSVQFTVTFTPAAPGVQNTNLTITSDDVDESSIQIPLSGTGTQVVIDVSPPSIDFGDQVVGTTSTGQIVTITNNGNANLNVFGPSLSGMNASDFSRSGTFPQVIGPGGNYQFNVFFTPSATGPRSATLTIPNNDPVNPSVMVSLSGNGIPPPTFVVTKTADTNDGVCDADCSLREAISGANSNADPGAITFASPLFDTPQTITLGSQLTISQPLTIMGPGARKLTISGNNAVRIFSVSGVAVTLSLSDLRLDAGSHVMRGGAIDNLGTLNINRCTISNSSSFDALGLFGRGGAIYNDGGTVTIIGSTLSGNSASIAGGAIHNGDVGDPGTLVLTNSTLSGNSSAGTGGAIYSNPGNTAVSNSTIAFNSATIGSGILGEGLVRSSIIAANVNNAAIPDVAGTFISDGYNLIGNGTGATGFVHPTDQVGPVPPLSPDGGSTPLDPGLDPFGDYGGPTDTYALSVQPISPAMDKGNSFGQVTEQRGFARTFDNLAIPNAAGGDGTDIGSFERLAPTAAGVSLSGRILTSGGLGIRNAKVTLYGGSHPEPLTVTTGSFGFYSFDGLQPGLTYLVIVETPRYVLAVPSRVITINDDVTEFDFVAEPLE